MITKRYFKTKDEVEVTFELSIPDDVDGVSVLCDATDWVATPMRRAKGAWRARLRLPVDQHIQFRYLASGGVWITDDGADGYVDNPHGGQNSVVDTYRP